MIIKILKSIYYEIKKRLDSFENRLSAMENNRQNASNLSYEIRNLTLSIKNIKKDVDLIIADNYETIVTACTECPIIQDTATYTDCCLLPTVCKTCGGTGRILTRRKKENR